MLIVELTNQATSAMQLILEKITIPTRANHLSRSRLLRILEESLATRSSTIINGRAGSGKTVLAADFAHKSGRPYAWYKIDAPDVDANAFFRYLIAGIQEQRPRFGREHLPRLLKSDGLPDVSLLADAFVFELLETGPDPLLIVIEDLHLICDAEWVIPFFSRLLPLLPTDVHVLITSRTMPPAPLWRMRSKQSLCVIEESELAFTRQEAIALFQSRGLPTEQATIALDHTHGRAGALQLCLDSLMRKPQPLFGSPAIVEI